MRKKIKLAQNLMQLLLLVHSRRKRKKRQEMVRTPEDHLHPSKRNSRQLHRKLIKTGILTFSLVIVLYAITLDTKQLTIEHLEGKT